MTMFMRPVLPTCFAYRWLAGVCVTPRIRCARCLLVIRRCCHVICLRVAFCHVIICISSTCFSKHSSGPFPRCPFRDPTLPHAPVALSDLVSRAGEKDSRNGPRFAKWPWYSTDRPPVKFRSIWSAFDTPTVNRVTAKAFCVLQPNTPPKWPNNPSKPLHVLHRRITIVWAKTTPHLDTPTSYL